MNNWKINKTVDLARGIDGVEVWPHALLVTGDKNAHEWNVTVMDNGKAASLDGIIQAYFVRSDGATVTATGSVAGNVATVTLPEACYAYEGDLSAVMQLIQDDASVTLSALLLRVRQITTDVIIDPGTEIPSLDDLLAQIENMKQATKDANAATTNANQAATDAETRVDEAISDAEGRVDTAVQSAETATSKANASSAAADASKAAADTAANAANEAADRANKAASGVGIRKKIVDVLPAKAEMEQDVLYLVRRAEPNAENVYDEYMLINGEVEAIGSTKTDLEDYATKEYVGEQIDAVEIGGVNLLLGTKDFSSDLFENIGGEIENESYLGFKVFHKADAWNTFRYHTNFEAKVGEIYTVSFYAKGTVQGKLGLYEISISLSTAEKTPFYIGSVPEAKITQWNRYAATFRIKTAGKFSVIVAGDTQHSNVGEIYVCGIKLERGNKATDWSPAPEDLDAKIDGIEIGGTNLLIGTKDISWPSWTNEGSHWTDAPMYKGLKVKKTKVPWQKLDQTYNNATVGETYTFSLYAKSESPSGFVVYIYYTGGYYSKFFKTTEEWKRYSFTFEAKTTEFNINVQKDVTDETVFVHVCGYKFELGNKATDWSPAPEDTDPRRAVITYDYGGRNLKGVFGTPEALHNALVAEDYSQIAVGDYWPITLNGTFRDYGSYTVKSGVTYYSNNTLNAQVGTTEATYEGTYVSDTAVSFTLSNNTYYVSTANCLDYFERTCNNVTVKLEVAGINHYWRYGDSGDLTGNKPHIVFVSRDCLPFAMRMRKGNAKWEDADATNPWIGSAIFKTLNDEAHGVLPLVAATDIGHYIYHGPNNLGMRALMEIKAPGASDVTNWDWYNRGKLFLPSVAEVCGAPFFADSDFEGGFGNQFAIFRDSRRHITKGNGDGAGRSGWWMSSSCTNSSSLFTFVSSGNPSRNDANILHCIPICFVFV